ncbi:C17orf53 [Branchiostoma lanceolatum]|uniref:C17orf53 protein n=1 Tax=Branchiostoma lanceolatum TaxID=7740 RepID=A0A8J9VQI7_BRALA|nr:C17orf53 [Branchiostoma lanceolatum]
MGSASSSPQLRNSASLQNKPASKGHVFGSKVSNSQLPRVSEVTNAIFPSTVSVTSVSVQCNPGIQATSGLRNPANAQFKSSGMRNPTSSTSDLEVQGNMGTQGTVGTSHVMSSCQSNFTQPLQPRSTQAGPRLPQRGGHSFAARMGNVSSTPRFTGQYGTPRVPQSAGMVAPRMQQSPRFQQTPRMQYTPTMHQTPRMPQGRGGPIRQRSPNGPGSGLYNSTFGQNTSEQGLTGSPGSFLSPQAPVCTSRLLKLCNASRPKDLTPRVKKRKFPGPAGILPKLSEDKQLDDVAIATPQTPSHSAVAKKPKDEDLTSSQLSQEDPRKGSWDTMKKELGLHEDNSSCMLGKNNIALVLRRASLKLLPQGKVPQLCVWVKLLSLDGRNGSVVFRDHTGEMQGTIHQKVLEEYPSEIKAGTTLVLRQVGVFSPSARNHYLNITLNNIVQVYPPGTKSGITSNPSSLDSPEMNQSPPPSWLKFQDTSPACTRSVVSQQATTTVGMGNTQKTGQHVQQLPFSSALGQNTAQVSKVVASGGRGTVDKPANTGVNTGPDGGKQQENVDELWGEDNLDELLEDIGEEMFGDF